MAYAPRVVSGESVVACRAARHGKFDSQGDGRRTARRQPPAPAAHRSIELGLLLEIGLDDEYVAQNQDHRPGLCERRGASFPASDVFGQRTISLSERQMI